MKGLDGGAGSGTPWLMHFASLHSMDGWRRMFLIHTRAGLTTIPYHTIPADYFLALHVEVEVDGET
jgi:hypothetical protein